MKSVFLVLAGIAVGAVGSVGVEQMTAQAAKDHTVAEVHSLTIEAKDAAPLTAAIIEHLNKQVDAAYEQVSGTLDPCKTREHVVLVWQYNDKAGACDIAASVEVSLPFTSVLDVAKVRK